jgi:hypothetical protein
MENRTSPTPLPRWKHLTGLVETGLDAFFHPTSTPTGRALTIAWQAGLFLAGLLLWTFFLNRGNLTFNYADWAEVNGPRLAIVQDAARQNILPLHTDNTTGLRGATDRYLGIADTPFSPQFYLLRFLSLGQFTLLNTLLLYSLGYLGLLLLGRKYRLSLFVFTLLFLIFNFNGHVVSHMAVGHINFAGHFLLPFLALVLLEVLEKPWSWRWVLKTALVLLTIFLQGDFHLYVWALIFMALLALVQPRRCFKPILIAGVATVAVCLVRILPPISVLAQMDTDFKNGFASLWDMLRALAVLRGPQESFQDLTILNTLGVWEMDTYVGVLGALFVGWFGVLLPLRKRKGLNQFQDADEGLLVPALLLALLSFGTLYKFVVTLLPVPIFSGERVTSRFLVLPLVMIAVLAGLNLQHSLESWKQSLLEKGLLLGLLFVEAFELLQHFKLWRVSELEGLETVFPKIPFDPALNHAIQRADPQYLGLFIAGAALSVVSLAVLVVLAAREKKPE